MPVSVIATVYNEGENIHRLLHSLAAQTCRADEIVICDGGSTDNTVALIRALAGALDLHIVVVEAPGANISRGRNLAIEAAAGPIIAVTDAGVTLAEEWLARLIQPFSMNEGVQGVAGFFEPDVQGVFETAMAATVLPQRDEISPTTFLPSSRSVAFTRTAWAEAGGYPEWLDYCEDLIFDLRFNSQTGGQDSGFVWAPDATVYFKPRNSLAAFWKQYYLYARGDGKADLWRKRQVARYGTYLILLPALIGHLFFGFFARWLGWVGLLAGLLAYCLRPWQRLGLLWHDLSTMERLVAVGLVPIIRASGDLAKMVGYPVGVTWRWRNRLRPEIYWRDELAARHRSTPPPQ